MQIMKFLRNKTAGFSDNQLRIEIDGQHFTKLQLLEARQAALDALARETEPDKVNQLAVTAAGLESAVKSFEPIERAQAMAHRRKRELQEADKKTALAAQQQFADLCDFLTISIMAREGDPLIDYLHSDSEKAYKMRGAALYAELYQKLSYEQAEKQFTEIDLSIRERRPWREIVPLPKYKSFKSERAVPEDPRGSSSHVGSYATII